MEWGELVRRLREDKGLTQENLADELSVDKSTIIRWEKQHKIPTPKLEIIAKVFHLSLSDLYNYKQNPSMLTEPLTYYQSQKKISVTIQLDGTPATLNEWFLTLKKINSAL